MRVLLVHNSYRQRGGEDAVFEAERDLLAAAGHEVVEYRPHNDATADLGRVALAARTIWSRDAKRELAALIRASRPEVAHFHNTLPLISPSGYVAAQAAGVPVVQTLHNYRMVCPSALLYRDGSVCEDCVGRAVPWPAVRHACYRGSRAASAAVTAMLATHRGLGTYRDSVDAWIALTTFQADLVARGGVPAERITVLPNFLATDPGCPPVAAPRDGLLFVGRLTEEKGVRVLLDIARQLPPSLRVRIVGDGPLRAEVDAAARSDPRIEVLGGRTPAEVDAEMRRAAALVLPSLWYEGLPMTLVEAFARGLPVVASDLGGLSALVEDGVDGRLVAAGDVSAFAAAIAELVADEGRVRAVGAAGRQAFDARFTAESHLDGLLSIYAAVARARRDGTAPVFDRPSSLATSVGRVATMTACRPSRRSTVDPLPGS